MELRCPDPACNPYLTFAALLQAGLEGVEKGYELPEPMEKNLYHLSGEERRRLGVEQLPESLGEAIEITAESELVLRTLGEPSARAVEFQAAQQRAALVGLWSLLPVAQVLLQLLFADQELARIVEP